MRLAYGPDGAQHDPHGKGHSRRKRDDCSRDICSLVGYCKGKERQQACGQHKEWYQAYAKRRDSAARQHGHEVNHRAKNQRHDANCQGKVEVCSRRKGEKQR